MKRTEGSKYEQLLTHIQELEGSNDRQAQEVRSLRHALDDAKRHAAELTAKLQGVQALQVAALSGLKRGQIYRLVAQAVVTQAGWDVAFTWYGLPKQLTPLPLGTPGLDKPGLVSVVSYDRTAFVPGCTCRDTLLFSTAKDATPKIGTYLNDVVKLMFGFK